MTQRPELPADIRAEVDSLLQRAGDSLRAGDRVSAEGPMLEAWDKLPEPKLGWNFYSDILPRGFFELYRDSGQFDKAERWLETLRADYGPGNASVEFLAATLWLETGALDRAFEAFDALYKAYKNRPFTGKNGKYLDFYLTTKKSKK